MVLRGNLDERETMRRFILVGLLLLGGLWAGALAPLAAQGAMGDAGSFRVLIDGRTAGTEEFAIRQSGAGANAEVVATGRVQLTLPSGALTLQPRLRATGLEAAPVSYEVTIDGSDPSRTVGTLRGGRFSARTFSPSGEQLREYVASSGAVVLDELVAHHYHFLAQRMRSGTVPVIIPRQNRQVMATVSDRGEERVEVAGTTARLYHLVVRPQGLSERHVWVDALGRVVKVEIPDANYVAIRTALPE